jgi:hypothetical protein
MTNLLEWESRINPNFIWVSQTERREDNFFYHPGTFFKPDVTFPYDVIILRVFSLGMGAGSLVFIYRASLLAFRDHHFLALITTALVAFTPQYIFITSSVNNDNLAIILGSLCIYLITRMELHRECTNRMDFIWLGICVGCGLLAKMTFASLFPFGLWQAFRSVQASTKDRLKNAGIYVLVVGFISGWWFLRNLRLYGDLLGRLWVVKPGVFAWDWEPKPLFDPYFRLSFFWRFVGQSFLGSFGFNNIEMPSWYYLSWLFLMVLSISGIILLMVYRKFKTINVGLITVYLLVVLLAIVQLVQFNLTVSQPQGRFVFHVFPAIAILFISGIVEFYSFIRSKFTSPEVIPTFSQLPSVTTTFLTIFVLVILNAYALFQIAIPAYTG